MDKLRASAAALNTTNNAKPESHKELPKSTPESFEESQGTRPEYSRELTRPQLSSGLRPNFFDNNDSQKPNISKFFAFSFWFCIVN